MTLEDLVLMLGTAVPVYVPATELPPAVVQEAIDAGLVSEWSDSPVGRAALLSSLACERLGLELADETEIECSRWVAVGTTRPTPARSTIGTIPDGAGEDPQPIDTLIAAEAVERARDRRSTIGPAMLVRPTAMMILGTGRTGWAPPLEVTAAKACPVCRGLALAPTVFCLGCARSGIDGRLPRVPDHEKPKAKPKGSAKGDGDGLAGGVGKAKAKGKNKSKTTRK